MVATWRAIWILIGLGTVLALGPGMFGVFNGLTILGLLCCVLALVFIIQRGWE
jgi:hypothetical protein